MFFDLLGIEDVIIPIEYCFICFLQFSEEFFLFKEETESQETLDDFYFWGELLISDFDDVDKNLVDY